jgi:hypothetical protein
LGQNQLAAASADKGLRSPSPDRKSLIEINVASL